MRQTGFVHPKRAAALADFYDLSADIVRRSDAPVSDTGSAYSSTGRPETTLHSDVPCHFEVLTGGVGERTYGGATLGTTAFTIGLQGMYSDIKESDDIIIDNVRYNILSVGIQRLAQRTRMRVARKPDA